MPAERTPRAAASAALTSLTAAATTTRASMNRPWACTGHDPSCTKSYVEKKALEKHIKLKHKNEGAICPYCNKIQPDTRVKPEHLNKCKREKEEREAEEDQNAIEEAVKMATEAGLAFLKQTGH